MPPYLYAPEPPIKVSGELVPTMFIQYSATLSSTGSQRFDVTFVPAPVQLSLRQDQIDASNAFGLAVEADAAG